VVITMRIMAPPPKPVPQLAEATVERLNKTDKAEPDIRIIPPSPDGGMMAAHQSSDPPPEPPMPAPKVEDVVPPVEPTVVEPTVVEPTPAAPPQAQAQAQAQSNNGICARYGGYKVTTYRHGWQSWHCVYPQRR
jgi:hypothetical protein